MKKQTLALVFLALLAACKPDESKLNGYVEGEYVRVAATTGGVLASLPVARGDKVKAGEDLFALDLTGLTAQRDADKAALAQAQSTWTDLTKGKRPEEIAVITQQKAQAEADLANTTATWQRAEILVAKDAASKQQRDDAEAAHTRAAARVAELDADLKVAVLGARDDQLAAAKAVVDAAAQKITEDEKLLREAAPKAPAGGSIEDTFFRPGEFVPAGTPVVSLLPPENVKIRFYVPQNELPKMTPGAALSLSCDGCKGPIAAKISYVSDQAEFTPPIIYSVGSRQKLVFLVEATPDAYDPELRPGLPVDIDLGAAQ